MTITQFNLLSFKPVVPLFSIYYSFLNIRPPKLVTERLSDTTLRIYISDTKAELVLSSPLEVNCDMIITFISLIGQLSH